MSESRKRSRNGCWTCKNLRQKCDGARPNCLNCQKSKRACEGFEVRLQWENGIASRGRFTGALQPIEDAILDRPKGRKRDLSRKQRQSKPVDDLAQSISTAGLENGVDESRAEDNIGSVSASPNGDTPTSVSSTSREESLFAEFLKTGIHALHATLENDFSSSDLPVHLPRLCQQSRALPKVCIALQASMSEYHKSEILGYFNIALRNFREELAQTNDYLDDGTMTSGLLLCTLSMMNGFPWTIHLRGMHQILEYFGLQTSSVSRFSPFRCHSIEVMGVLDLPTLTLGRQNPCLGVWKRYCRSPDFQQYVSDRDSVEHVSGLPRSLLDILCEIGEGSATELDFWDWPGARGSFIQIQLWEAYRLAAILTIRHRNLQSALGMTQVPGRTRPDLRSQRPEDYHLLTRLLSHLDALMRAYETLEQHGNRLLNAIQYPSCVAGLEVLSMNENPGWKELVRSCFLQHFRRVPASQDTELLLGVLGELWQAGIDRPDIDKILRERGLEISLV